MKRVAKPRQLTDLTSVTPKVDDIPVSDISIDQLISDGLLVLFREIKNLKTLSVRGKLDPADARDLRDHIKLLFELRDRESSILKNLSPEELTTLLGKNDNEGSDSEGTS